MIRKTFTLLIALLLGILYLQAQQTSAPSSKDYNEYPYWIEMMQDHSVNFFEVQKAFEAYWEAREIKRSSGWKQFKRWEWWQERHIYPDGTRHEADKVYKAYMKYLAVHPQAKDSNGDWTNIGPIDVPSKGYEGLGRINAIAFHPTDPDIVYIGAPAGGCWRYNAVTSEWHSTTDAMPTLGVSAIVVDWSNPDNIYIGTGDRDAGNANGMGVFRSTDAGNTWEIRNNGMGNKTVGRMVQHPVDADIMFAATSGGFFKTTDAGVNWVFKSNVGTKEIVFKPNDPATMYAGGNGKFYKSTDTGETWVQITNGISNGSRSVIAVSPANPEIVYCFLSTSDSYKGIYRSADSGESFTEMSTTPNIMSWDCNGGDGGQAWYDMDVAVDPADPNVIFAGGVNCFKSTDGGASWQISSHWWGDCSVPAVHADLHVLEFNPLNNRLYAGNDGGIYYTDNGGTSWPEITSGLPISQVYKIGQAKTDINKVINGYQDNGTSSWFGNNNWQTTNGGDGMECAFDHENPNISYSTLYYGDIYRHQNNNGSYQVAGNGSHGMNEGGGWVTPFCLHEGDASIMFGGYKNIWRTEGVNTNNFTWKKITSSGGGDIDVVEHSPANYDLFYYARNGQLYRSDNVNDEIPEWVSLTTSLPGGGNVFDVEAHPFNADIVYITQGAHVYVSGNKGYSWSDISGSLPDINMNTLAYYVNSFDGLYVGSDAGIYYRDASMNDWIMFSDGLPVDASVNEVEIYHNPDDPAEDVIRAGTFGRGLWSSPVWHGQPVAAFEADETEIPVGCPVNFTDLSTGVPTEWLWTFNGADPSISTEKNPEGIIYLSDGTYAVSLTVSNSEGTDTQTIEGYITVSSSTLPQVNFTASDSITCSGQEIQFTDLSANCPTGWIWDFDPNTVSFVNGSSATSQNPEVIFDEAGAYTVTLTVSNTSGNNTLVKEDYINIGGIDIPFTDDFESGTLDTKSWTVENPDFDITWDLAAVSGNGQSTMAARMNFFDYVVPPGQRDRMITPVLNMEGFDDVVLMFDHAYAKRHTTVTDSLIVKISSDCGNTWERIFANGEDNNGSFATHELMTDPFVPEVPDDWCGNGWGANCIVLDLSEWAGQGNFQVMFEAYNYFGNNLYIDNVMIGPMTGLADVNPERGVLIFPNPTQGIVNIVVPEKLGDVSVSILNLQGKEVRNYEIHDGSTFRVDLSQIGSGVYFVHVNMSQSVEVRKIVVN